MGPFVIALTAILSAVSVGLALLLTKDVIQRRKSNERKLPKGYRMMEPSEIVMPYDLIYDENDCKYIQRNVNIPYKAFFRNCDYATTRKSKFFLDWDNWVVNTGGVTYLYDVSTESWKLIAERDTCLYMPSYLLRLRKANSLA